MPLARTLGVTLALLLSLVGPGVATERAAGTIGSPSGGDPYFPKDGNGGYDVGHYSIHDTYRPRSDRLTGHTVVRATATKQLTVLHLDLVLTPDQVSVDGRPARFTKPDRHTLRIVPPSPVADGAAFRVMVRYHGRPSTRRAVGVFPDFDLFFHRPGETVAMGEPRNGPWWFAANETPGDRATYEIAIRVPRGRQAISNGRLVSRTTGGDWTTWRWRMGDPMATYLAFFAAGSFRLDQGVIGGRRYLYAVSRRLSPSAQRQWLTQLRRSDGVVAWLEGHLGVYPFDVIGGVATRLGTGYALETQSRPVYPGAGGVVPLNLVVHELAHQWFGNDVGLRRWRHIWLNEGFATFAEWWYGEEHGAPTVEQRLRGMYDTYAAGSFFWDLRISDPGRHQMFANAVYDRGAMTLAALRARIGQGPFATLMLEWVARNRSGFGTTSEFRALAEEVSGEDLNAFFTEWLDETDKPANTTENGLG